jgi:signal transduction histidine kinase
MLTELIKTRLNGQGREVVPLLTKISDNSNRMYQGTKDFIWAINPEHDNLYEVAIRLKDFGDDIFDKTGVRFEVEGLHEHLRPGTLPMGASRHIVFLFKEAMSNTLKHAQATETRLRFARAGSCLRAEWEDNGTGFEPPQAGRGNGLTNMEQRARKIGGRVVVSSSPRVGTRITFELDSSPSDVPQSG